MKNRVWISWEHHRRSTSISQILEAQLFELGIGKNGLRRYGTCLWQTLRIITIKRPEIVFVQNPSVILAVFSTLLGRMLSIQVVIDAHNVGITFEHPRQGLRALGQFLDNVAIRMAKLTIVTNSFLAEKVTAKGGVPFVLPDPIPQLWQDKTIDFSGKVAVLAICTFAGDEPYQELLQCGRFLPPGIEVYVTGNCKKINLGKKTDGNVKLTGFLAEQDYIDYLGSVDIILDLTTREGCLVCGAYEGLAMNKPLILSDTKALRDYFGEAASYTANSAQEIAQTIVDVKTNLLERKESAFRQKELLVNEYKDRLEELNIFMGSQSTPGMHGW